MEVQQEGHLSRFVKDLMASRKMTIHEVKANATTEITESYISGIIRGSSCNPSVRKLVALASGLGVDAVELFKVAAGLSGDHMGAETFPDAVTLIAIMKRIVSNDNLFAVMSEALLLEADDRRAALGILRALNEARHRQARTAGSA